MVVMVVVAVVSGARQDLASVAGSRLRSAATVAAAAAAATATIAIPGSVSVSA